MSGTLTRVMVISLMIYLAITVFMHNVVLSYLAGSDTTQNINTAVGVTVGDGSISTDVNGLIYKPPEPQISGGLPTELSFMASFISIKDYFMKAIYIAFTPALLLQLPDTIVPAAIKIFVLVPINLITFVSIIAFIRGYTL